MSGPRQTVNPAVAQEPDLPGRAATEFRRVMDLLLDRLAARDLNDPRFRQDRSPDDLTELTAAAQVLRMLAKPGWSEDDLHLFAAYFPTAARSQTFGDEFEEARFRIRSYVDAAWHRLGHTAPPRAACR